MGIVYLLKLVNCIKFGKTDDFITKFTHYKLSEPQILLCLSCKDNKESEREILKELRTKYKTRDDLGKNYFDLTSNIDSMISDIYHYLYKSNNFNKNNHNLHVANNENSEISNDNKIFICKRCEVEFTKKKYLVQHLKRRIPCIEINETNQSREEILEELLEKEKTVTCKDCDRKYKNIITLNNHKCKGKIIY